MGRKTHLQERKVQTEEREKKKLKYDRDGRKSRIIRWTGMKDACSLTKTKKAHGIFLDRRKLT